jgi:hypothetical protein
MKDQIEKQAIKGMCENCIHNELCEVMLKLYRIVKVPPRMCKLYEDNAGYRKQSENTVELPCNIGDSCYPLPRYRTPIVERKVSRITFSKRNVIIGYYENDGQYRPPLRTRVLGEDVFLTKEEAEAKMKGENK